MADSLETQMEQVLTIYSEEVNERLREITTGAMKELVKKTKASAPRGKRNGQFRRKIAGDYTGTRKSARGLRGQAVKAVWYVKAPDYRLTHLIVYGHATRNGGRTAANPFLQNAVDEVIPEYERQVQEALSNGG